MELSNSNVRKRQRSALSACSADRDLKPSKPGRYRRTTGSAHSTRTIWVRRAFQSTMFALENHPAKLFGCLAIFRLLNVLFIRSAFDPDEYWQTLEPAYCTVFADSFSCFQAENCCHLTWEWTRRAAEDTMWWEKGFRGPVRSYLSVLPVDILYRVLRWIGLDTHWWIARGPMVLQALTVAAPIDWLTWCVARYVYSDASIAYWALFASISSWFGAFCWVRTYANTQEALLLLLALFFAFRRNERFDPLVFVLGGLSVAIRFTAVVAFVPLGIFLASSRTTAWWETLLYLLRICAICGLIGISLGLLVDRIFYDFWAFPFLGSFHFNAVLGLADLYGSHPWHWYWTVGVPAVSGLLTPLLPLSIWHSPRLAKTGELAILRFIAVIYTAVLSMSPHKEFRFLLPVLPIVCILVAPVLKRFLEGRSSLLVIWISVNSIAVVFLGLFHQSGAISVNHEIVRLAREQPVAREFSVHYLMPCHSTPSRSYLHNNPSFELRMWHLDCSPSCRESNSCENNAFDQDPTSFLRAAYRTRGTPDFAVTMSETEGAVLSATTGLRVVARFPYSLTGIKWEPSLEIVTRDVVLFSRYASQGVLKS